MSRHDDHSYNDHDIAWLDDHGASNNHDHVHDVVHDVHVVHHNDGASDNHDLWLISPIRTIGAPLAR